MKDACNKLEANCMETMVSEQSNNATDRGTPALEGFRLSPQQKQLWLAQANQSNSTFRVECVVRIDGPLSVDTLSAAILDTVERHEILRTCFYQPPGVALPIQIITTPNVDLEQHDLSTCDDEQQNSRLQTLLQNSSEAAYQFAQGPLFRAQLITLSKDRRVLKLGLPALCADTTTLALLVKDITNGYAVRLGLEDRAEETMQYADIAEWQNETLEAEDGDAARQFWHKQDLPSLLGGTMPFALQPIGNQPFTPRSIDLTFDATARLHQVDTAQPNLSAAGYLACWQILLQQLTGQAGLVIGIHSDGRHYPELTEALGPLAKSLPLKFVADEEMSFSAVVQHIDATMQDAFARHEHFAWPSTQLAPADVVLPWAFEFLNWQVDYRIGDVRFSAETLYQCSDRFKLKLSCVRQSSGLALALHYDAALFRLDDIERLAAQLRTLITNAAASPRAQVAALETLDADQRRLLLVEFNQTARPYPDNQCIHHVIEAQAAAKPQDLAVVCDGQSLTYAELDRLAQRLALKLQTLGVGADVLVGLCVERSLDMIVGILGILKAGGAYLPLDIVRYPKDRIRFMLADTKAPIVLTQQHLIDALPEHAAQVICLDTDWQTAPPGNVELENRSTPNDLAYVIYTSGSTGMPKGVLVTHRNLVHSTHARLSYYQRPVRHFALLSSVAFDSSVAGIFWTLCQGGTLHLPPQGIEQDPTLLAQLIAEHQVSHMLCLPSVHGLILEQSQPTQLASLNTVIVAGEACPARLTNLHHQRLPGVELFNEYGPTEGSVWSTVYHVASPMTGQVPIGRPIANMRAYVLDPRQRPVPIGVPGELHIGGAGITRGYLNQPELTAEKFIRNPFDPDPRERLYRTGDLVRWLADGNLEFLGRIDHQVKIRGYRIELGEIEANLLQHPAIGETVVVTSEDSTGEKRLVAYLVPREASLPTTAELRRFLLDALPEYMVPWFFVALSALPLTPNGKVDRKALPDPDRSRATTQAYVAPRNAVEEVIAGIWRDVLGIDQIGIHNNFFELGGHSLLVTQVVARLRDNLQIELPLRTLFEAPTVAELGEALMRDPLTRENVEQMAQLLIELVNMSDDEVELMLKQTG